MYATFLYKFLKINFSFYQEKKTKMQRFKTANVSKLWLINLHKNLDKNTIRSFKN